MIVGQDPYPAPGHAGGLSSRPFSRANQLLADQGAGPVEWKLPFTRMRDSSDRCDFWLEAVVS
ncbi:hypothetical protein [Amycolatopsis sp. w19]|uniref:hypothetical protein n=1 Tax=Amycolatopsis sp. w19 TaxID=3448134 RepID=UPI003F1B8BDB